MVHTGDIASVGDIPSVGDVSLFSEQTSGVSEPRKELLIWRILLLKDWFKDFAMLKN